MTYTKLLNMNKAKAKKQVVSAFGKSINQNSAYHTIYDLSESTYKNDSISLDDFVKNILISADFAGMTEEYSAITEAYKQYLNNEAFIQAHF